MIFSVVNIWFFLQFLDVVNFSVLWKVDALYAVDYESSHPVAVFWLTHYCLIICTCMNEYCHFKKLNNFVVSFSPLSLYFFYAVVDDDISLNYNLPIWYEKFAFLNFRRDFLYMLIFSVSLSPSLSLLHSICKKSTIVITTAEYVMERNSFLNFFLSNIFSHSCE